MSLFPSGGGLKTLVSPDGPDPPDTDLTEGDTAPRILFPFPRAVGRGRALFVLADPSCFSGTGSTEWECFALISGLQLYDLYQVATGVIQDRDG